MKTYRFEELKNADLVIDAVYEGGRSGNITDDPIHKLLPGCSNQGGFRAASHGKTKKFVVLYTDGQDPNWPDNIDSNTGRFEYYGDNKTPGHKLHETSKRGNELLKNVFDWLHSFPPKRERIPPFLILLKHPTENSSRSVQFKGLAVPGFPGLTAKGDLVAVWKTAENQRFQNYRATLTILDIDEVKRDWIDDHCALGSKHAPPLWINWIRGGPYTPLTAEPTTIVRSVDSQSPQNRQQEDILLAVFDYFAESPTSFELFAAQIFKYLDSRVIIDEITRSAIDGGRDAVGRYLLGLNDDPVYAHFSLEAKCYQPRIRGQRPNTVGVKEVSRLISRLRHREFGILVTTSAISKQAYQEVREDRHPIIFLCGRDIAEILIKQELNTPESVREMLRKEYPLGSRNRNISL